MGLASEGKARSVHFRSWSVRMLGVLTVTTIAGAFLQSPSPVLAPVTKWNVEYLADGCRLQRKYGDANNVVTLAFVIPPLQPDNMGLSGINLIVSPPFSLPTKGSATASFDSAYKPFEGVFHSAQLRDESRLIQPSIAELTPQALRDAKKFVIAFGDGRSFGFDMASAPTAFAALETCRRDLVTGWKIDPDEYLKIKTAPIAIGDESTFISPDDYPSGALGSAGTTRIHWTINDKGNSVDCVVDSSSGVRALDIAACRAIEARGRYRPATGLDGKPMASHKSRKVKWNSVVFSN